MYHLQVSRQSPVPGTTRRTLHKSITNRISDPRRRRVKCDEGRPRCARCVKAGKPCEGYATGPHGGGEPVRFVVYSAQHMLLMTDTPDLDWSERRSLSYFEDRTAVELAGGFTTNFWLATILPLARQETAVRHALIALSSMHEHYAGVDHFSPTKGVDFAFNHYGKAIREIVRLNQSQADKTFEHAVVTSALFLAFESLQGDYHTACKHAISGIKILAEEQRSLVSPSQVRVPREDLLRFFTAIRRQILELGDPNFHGAKPTLLWGMPSLPARFSSYEQAMLHMEVLLTDVFDWADRADGLADLGPIPVDLSYSLMLEFRSIKTNFEQWSTAFSVLSAEAINSSPNGHSPESVSSMKSHMTPSPSPTPSTTTSTTTTATPPKPPAVASMLKVYQALMTAFLHRIEIADESVMAAYMDDFWSALDAAEDFIRQTSHYVTPTERHTHTHTPSNNDTTLPQTMQTPIVRPTFSLALGVVPVLFLIATRAHNAAVSARALSLLQTCNRREGVWDSRLAARLVERVLEIKRGVELVRGPDSGVVLKIVDTAFLPAKRCLVRYRLVSPQTVPGLGGEGEGEATEVAGALWEGTKREMLLDDRKDYYVQIQWGR